MSAAVPEHLRAEAVSSPLPAGMIAPDFRLQHAPNQTLALYSLRGRPVLLVFYPGDWRPVCSDQLALYQEFLPHIERLGAALIAISVDSVWSHQAFAQEWGLAFPLLADFEPKGAVARIYGVYREDESTSERALFVVDADGIIRWSYVAPVVVDPGIDGVLTALERLQSSQKT